MIIALFATSSVFAQNYSCSTDHEGLQFKIENKTLKGGLMTGLGTRLASSTKLSGSQTPNTYGSYDLLDEKGSHGKLTIVTQSTYHRSGLLGTSVSVNLDYLGEALKFYDCTVKSDVIVSPLPTRPLPEFPCHTRNCAF